MDVAQLGIRVDTRQVKQAAPDLDRLAKSARKTEQATDGVARSAANTNAVFRKTSTVAATVGRSLAAVAAGYASIEAARRAITVARDFNSALAETSTLIKGTPQELDALTKGAMELTKAYGGTATAQVKAYYQAISAGAGSVAEATKLLDQANKLAIGGVTDVTTGVDALTTAVNAYSATGLTAAEASDALFVGMRAGKTTVAELGNALGQVVPVASAAGVSFDEVVAGVSALTTQGQTTAMATTGLRQVIASVVKPTKQASDMAAELGLSFNAQALEAQGLAAFLDEVVEKTDGNTDAMAQLFGSVEALNAALAFAGGAGEKFSGIMEGMADKAGATDAALEKVQSQLSQRLNVALGELSTIGLQAGNSLLTVFVPAVEGAVAAAQLLADNIDILASSMIALAASQIPNLVASLGTIVTAAGAAAVALRGVGAAAWAATGPWGLLAGLVAGAASYFLVFKENAGKVEDPLEKAKDAQEKLNTQIAVFATTYAPAAGAEAVNTANDYYALSKAAYDVAAAELAKKKAYAEGAAANFAPGPVQRAAAERAAVAARELAAAQKELANAEAARTSTALRVMRADREMAETQKKLAGSIDVTVDGVNGLGDGLSDLGGGLKGAADDAASLSDALSSGGGLMTAVEDVSRAWGDFVVDGFRDFKSFTDAVLGSFKNMLAQMIATATRNKIMIALGVTGTGIAGSAAAGALGGGGGGLLGNLLGLGNIGSGLLGGGGFLGGIGTGLGGVLSGGGLGSSFANLGGLLSGSVGGAGAIGAALPALGVIAGGVALLVKGLSQKYAGTALRGSLGPEGFDGTSFDFYRGGFLRGDDARYKDVPEEIQSMLDATMGGVAESVRKYADTLNLTADGISEIAGEQFTIWTNGKSQQEITEALNSEIDAVANEMAALVLGTTKFTRAGESAMDTLTRLGTGLAAVNDAADLLGHRMWRVSLASADAASELVEAFGGLEAMTGAVNTFWTTMYTEAERTETTIRRLRTTFADLGVAMPESRQAYRDLVEGLDTTTEKGRELYAELIKMAGALDQVLPTVADFTLSMQGLLGKIGGEVGSMLDSARENARITEQAARLWYRTAETLRDFLGDLLNTNLTAASPAQQAARNRMRFQTAFEMARGGDVEAARDIPELAKAYLQSARATASTSLEYRRIAAQVQGQVQFLSGIAELEGANKDVLQTLYEKQIEVLTSLGNFLQLEGLTDEQIASLDAGVRDLVDNWGDTTANFESVLGDLESAIKEAQNFSYDKLLADLDVAISLADRTDLPGWLVDVVEAAGDDIRTTLDFIIRRNDLTPDMRWIAVNAVSEHIKTLDFIVRNDLTNRQAHLALSAGGELRRNIILTLTRDVDPETRMIALAGSSELSRVVNVALDRIGSDDRALTLALRNVHRYAVTVTAGFGREVPARLRNMILRQSGSYAAMIEAAVTELDGRGRRILLAQQGRYIANITASVASTMPLWKRRLLVNAITRAARLITVRSAFAGDLSMAERRLLTRQHTRADRTIKALMTWQNFGLAKHRFLRQLERRDTPVRRLVGRVDLSGLNGRQRAMIDAISGVSRGTVTLGGAFRFAPEDAFSTWYESTTRSLIANPMGRLGTLLERLRSTIQDDLDQKARIGEVTARGAKWADKLAAFRDNWGAASRERVSGLKDRLEGLVADTGVSLKGIRITSDGRLVYDSSGVSGTTAQVAAFRASGFWAKGGLQDRIAAANANRMNALAFRDTLQDRLEALREQVVGLGGIPTFAHGGLHSGGLRIVGERGPELEDTTPSRIYSAGETRSMLDNRAVVAELRALREEVGHLRDENQQLMLTNIRHSKRAGDTLNEWRKTDGVPVKNPADGTRLRVDTTA